MKDQIIETANKLLIERGYNAFSYHNISKEINIKTSSIHYHFPSKSDLGIAVVKMHNEALEQTIVKTANKTPIEKLNTLFAYYNKLVAGQKVCIVGALTSDINTLDAPLREELMDFANAVMDWATGILQEGQSQKVFRSLVNTEMKAKQIMASLMTMSQLSRIEKDSTAFEQMTQMIIDELTI